LEATARDLPAGVLGRVLPADLARDEMVLQLSAAVPELDILVLAAGEYATGSMESTPVETFDRLYRANLHANYLLVQAFLPALKRRRGQVVFVNSSTGLGARPDVSMFSATNHGLKALADALRAEVNADGIRVLSVHPGRTATPRLEAMYAAKGDVYKPELLLQPEDVASVVMNALTLPRTAEVTDISMRPLKKSY
jgi:NADP-dependent 3-hydroxy acid dehydrogenase YdfG